MDGQEYLSEIL